jgi:hypothetical protein
MASNFYSNYKRIQILQNKVVRITGKYVKVFNDIVTCYRNLRVMNVGHLRDYQSAIFVYQCWKYIYLIFMISSHFYKSNSCLHEYSTRNVDNLVIEHRQSTRAGFTIRYLGPSVCNELPASTKAAEHLQQFKKRLKKYLLGGEDEEP